MSYLSELEIDSEEEKAALQWLRQSEGAPLDEVIPKWKLTFRVRSALLKDMSLNEYYELFPCLSVAGGHQLVSLKNIML